MKFLHFEVRDRYFRYQYLPPIEEKYKQFQTFFGSSEVQKMILRNKKSDNVAYFVRHVLGEIMGFPLPSEPESPIQLKYKEKYLGIQTPKVDVCVLKQKGYWSKVYEKTIMSFHEARTKDFREMVEIAFRTANHYCHVRHVIVSNFQKLRFYLKHWLFFEEFDLFNLTFHRFRLLYLLLNSKDLLKGLPAQLAEESHELFEYRNSKLYYLRGSPEADWYLLGEMETFFEHLLPEGIELAEDTD